MLQPMSTRFASLPMHRRIRLKVRVEVTVNTVEPDDDFSVMNGLATLSTIDAPDDAVVSVWVPEVTSTPHKQ